jgi:hypothetical protein
VVRINGARLAYEAGLRGLTLGELGRLAKVPPATMARARAGRPLQPRTLKALAAALTRTEPLPGAEGLTVPPTNKKTPADPGVFGSEVGAGHAAPMQESVSAAQPTGSA